MTETRERTETGADNPTTNSDGYSLIRYTIRAKGYGLHTRRHWFTVSSTMQQHGGSTMTNRTQSDMNKLSVTFRETNDCTVRANAHAFDISYGKAHRHLAKFGRPRGSGPSSDNATLAVLDMAERLGLKAVTREDLRGLTLNKFYKQYASKGGAWVVFIKGHAIGFRDGITTDWTGHERTGEIVRRKTAKLGYRADCACIQIL